MTDHLLDAARDIAQQDGPQDDDDLDVQAEWLAHDLWSFGVTIRHKGKCVADDESNYANRCEPCQTELIRAARDMVAEGWRKPE